MVSPPQTIDEARARRYEKWPGAPNGYAYNEGKCAYEHFDSAGWQMQQCRNKNGKGVNGLYCGIHAKIVEREINAQSAQNS